MQPNPSEGGSILAASTSRLSQQVDAELQANLVHGQGTVKDAGMARGPGENEPSNIATATPRPSQQQHQQQEEQEVEQQQQEADATVGRGEGSPDEALEPGSEEAQAPHTHTGIRSSKGSIGSSGTRIRSSHDNDPQPTALPSSRRTSKTTTADADRPLTMRTDLHRAAPHEVLPSSEDTTLPAVQTSRVDNAPGDEEVDAQQSAMQFSRPMLTAQEADSSGHSEQRKSKMTHQEGVPLDIDHKTHIQSQADGKEPNGMLNEVSRASRLDAAGVGQPSLSEEQANTAQSQGASLQFHEPVQHEEDTAVPVRADDAKDEQDRRVSSVEGRQETKDGPGPGMEASDMPQDDKANAEDRQELLGDLPAAQEARPSRVFCAHSERSACTWR